MLETSIRRYADRRAAGRELGERLSSLAVENPIVLGLARGGMPVTFEVARALRAPLDVLVVRKIGAPGNPELGIGAIADGDVRVLNQELASKTVPLPANAGIEAIEDIFTQAWRRGLKSIAVYRDGSKLGQPLTADED